MASQKQQYTILYGRLSQEDERAGESNSIQHQRDLLEKYARDKGFENTLFLADDGYSRAVEQMTDNAPVRDGTTMLPHIDSKRRKKLRQKKTALGHAEDDHEEMRMDTM